MKLPIVVKFPSLGVPPIDTHDGRRAWAFLAVLGGCMVFTAMAIFAVWHLRTYPEYTFGLALAAHVQAFLGMGALGWAMGRRMEASVNRDGASYNDKESK